VGANVGSARARSCHDPLVAWLVLSPGGCPRRPAFSQGAGQAGFCTTPRFGRSGFATAARDVVVRVAAHLRQSGVQAGPFELLIVFAAQTLGATAPVPRSR